MLPAAEATNDWRAVIRRGGELVSGCTLLRWLADGPHGPRAVVRRRRDRRDLVLHLLPAGTLAEVRRRCRLLASFEHPLVARIVEQGERDGLPWVTTAHVGDASLRDELRRHGGRRPDARALAWRQLWFVQTCRAAAALHARGLLPLDLDPGNLWLAADGSALCLDAVFAPPVHWREPVLECTDVLALAWLWVELVAGRAAFRADRHAALAATAATAPAAAPTIASVLTENPPRIHDAAALARALPLVPVPELPAHRVLPSVVSPARPDRAPDSRARLRRNEPATAGIAPFVLAMLLAAGLWLMLLMRFTRGTSDHALAFALGERAVPRAAPVEAVSGGSSLDHFVVTVLRRARQASQRDRAPQLVPLDLGSVGASRDVVACRRLLEPLVNAPTFVAGHAAKLARHGRPMFLAAVAMLQEVDVDSDAGARRAAQLQRFCAAATGVDELVVAIAGEQPSASEACRLLAIADGWRELAERFAASDADFDSLCALRTRAGGRR